LPKITINIEDHVATRLEEMIARLGMTGDLTIEGHVSMLIEEVISSTRQQTPEGAAIRQFLRTRLFDTLT
jgi:hypothetical protein